MIQSQRLIETDKPIAAYKRFDPAFLINFHRTFQVINTEDEVNHFFRSFPNGYLITNDRNIKALQNNPNIHKLFECKSLI